MMTLSNDETIFIMYEDIIRSLKFGVMKKLLTDEYRPFYGPYLDYTKFENVDDDELFRLIRSSADSNILKHFMKMDFDPDTSYISIINDNDDICDISKSLTMCASIHILIAQSFVKKIYVYTPNYYESIHKDLNDTFKSMEKIIYCNGDLPEVLANISEKITTFIINDANIIHTLNELNKLSYTSILIPEYAYNYKLNKDNELILKIDDIDNLSKNKIFKVGMFTP